MGCRPLESGFKYGAGISASQKIGDWTITGGLSTEGKSISNIYGGASYDDGKYGLSYYHTAYMTGHKQRTGTFGARSGNFSLRWENDVIGDNHDRFRSNATELGYKDYHIGTNVYTNDPNRFGEEIYSEINGSKIFNNKFDTYEHGNQFSSPLYIGMKSGNNMRRVGWNHSAFGDFFQNGFHHLKVPFVVAGVDVIKSPNFNLGNYNNSYYQTGTYKPWSLY